jgi:ABC-type uncharacterized transport system permease subunit
MILGVAPQLAALAATPAQGPAVPAGVVAVGLASISAYALTAWASMGERGAASWRAMLVAWGLHAVSLVLEVVEPGRGARFGFAPALSMTLWLVVGAHAIERRSHALLPARRVVSLAALASIALALVFPGGAHVADSPWAPLHWLLGLVSYGLIGAAVLHALMLDRAERKLRERPSPPSGGRAAMVGLPLLTLERLTFRFVDAGFLVLTLAVALGSWFAWSRSGWRWDHKTVFSLLGWAVMALLVFGRHARGWRGLRATRWIYTGAVLLLLAYVGSRFVFEVLLGRVP